MKSIKQIATYLIAGLAVILTAMLVSSCEEKIPPPTITDPETTPTTVSRNLTSVESTDGVRKRRIETPLLEEFDEAANPFTEFKEGVKVEVFAGDSVTIEMDLIADYAHYDKKQKLWEAKGNVIGRNLKKDMVLYTEQLFYNESKKKIYTHMPAKMVDRGRVHRGIGFEADENLEEWEFNQGQGQLEIGEDSTKNDRPRDTVSTSLNSERKKPSPDEENAINSSKSVNIRDIGGESKEPGNIRSIRRERTRTLPQPQSQPQQNK